MAARAVIFDMDGVIVDSEPLNEQHQTEYFKRIGIGERPDRSLRGLNSHSLWTSLKAEYGLEQDVDQLVQSGRESYMAFLEALPELPIVPGVRKLIEQFSRSGYERALASSANPRRVTMFLERLDLARYFDVVVHGDDVVHGKPDPEAFLLAAQRLSVEPRDCVAIEDSRTGVLAAKAAGMLCIGYSGLASNNEDLSGADRIVTDFGHFADFIGQGHSPADLPPIFR